MKAWLQLMGEAASSMNPRSKRSNHPPPIIFNPPPPPPPPPQPPPPPPPPPKLSPSASSTNHSHQQSTSGSGTGCGKHIIKSASKYRIAPKPKPQKKPINFGFYPPEYEKKFKNERTSFRKPRRGLYP